MNRCLFKIVFVIGLVSGSFAGTYSGGRGTAEERADGEVKRKLGVVFIRGDTITVISPT